MRNEFLTKEHFTSLEKSFLFREGYEEGYNKGLGGAVRSLLKKKYSVPEIAGLLNLPQEQVEFLLKANG